MHERIPSILGHRITGIVVAEREIGDMPFELHLCFADGTTYEIHSATPQWGYHSRNRLPMVADRIKATSTLNIYGDAKLDRPRGRRRFSRGAAFRAPILQILREHGGRARRTIVLTELPPRMRHGRSAIDQELLPPGWKRLVAGEIRLMRKEKLLYPTWLSERGTWALAPAGHQIAEKLHADYKALVTGESQS